MVTALSQDLVSQASSGTSLQRGSCAPAPLRYPVLCFCCRSESVCTACIALFSPLLLPPLPPPLVLAEAMCSALALLVTTQSGVYFIHVHT